MKAQEITAFLTDHGAKRDALAGKEKGHYRRPPVKVLVSTGPLACYLAQHLQCCALPGSGVAVRSHTVELGIS